MRSNFTSAKTLRPDSDAVDKHTQQCAVCDANTKLDLDTTTAVELLPLVLGKHDVPEVTQRLPVWSTRLFGACLNPVQEGLSNGPVSPRSNSPINNFAVHVRLGHLLVKPVDHFDHREALGDVKSIVCVAQDVEHLQQNAKSNQNIGLPAYMCILCNANTAYQVDNWGDAAKAFKWPYILCQGTVLLTRHQAHG